MEIESDGKCNGSICRFVSNEGFSFQNEIKLVINKGKTIGR